MTTLIIALFSGCLGLAGAWAVNRYGARWGLIDVPNHRSSHTEPVPKGGGVGITAALAWCAWMSGIPFLFWGSAVVLSTISLVGDIRDFPASIRLILQCVIAFVALCALSAEIHGALLIICVVIVVGTANCYNFMDGINGIAGITGILGFGLLYVYGSLNQCDVRFVTLALAMALACLGFLPFNFPRARVFMGDAGSIVLGFTFACIMIVFSHDISDVLVMAGFLFPFYMDELFTMSVRIRNGENLMQAHRTHVYQYLVNELGIDHWKIAMAFGMLQLMVGGGLLMLRDAGPGHIAGFWAACIILSGMIGNRIRTQAHRICAPGIQNDLENSY